MLEVRHGQVRHQGRGLVHVRRVLVVTRVVMEHGIGSGRRVHVHVGRRVVRVELMRGMLELRWQGMRTSAPATSTIATTYLSGVLVAVLLEASVSGHLAGCGGTLLGVGRFGKPSLADHLLADLDLQLAHARGRGSLRRRDRLFHL